MKKISYRGYRFPPEIIHQAIWLYLRFTLSLRDVEDLLAERGIMVSYETVRRWVNHFGPMIAADLRKRRPKPHTTWHLDEVYLNIAGRMVYLWRAVDAEGEVLDVLVQQKEQACGAETHAQAFEEVWLCPRQARHGRSQILCGSSQ
jgi:putative transposase